jgi:hypothetical protein
MANKENVDVDILEDYVFKLVFGKISSKTLLEHFFERIINKKVEVDQILNTKIVREIFDSKTVSLDVVVRTVDDNVIAI